ncbi:hypothetical protein ZWY2020_059965 [Hordeum vulgare]|nr:hypothetical protein ZWY2020_059965 [Hordeum vulgare]
MSVKTRTTCTWTERPYEALLFPGMGFGPFLGSLGGRRRRPPSGGPEPSVRYHAGRARILTGWVGCERRVEFFSLVRKVLVRLLTSITYYMYSFSSMPLFNDSLFQLNCGISFCYRLMVDT